MKLALAGDTMLGRKVAERIAAAPPSTLFADEIVATAGEADLFMVNLECVISARGARWPDPRKPFFFRAPPVATHVLRHLGVHCVTLANNHTLDYGPVALRDTIAHLDAAGIAHVGAGADEAEARRPLILHRSGMRIGIVAVTDHPAAYAAGPSTPGVAYADLRNGPPPWLLDTIAGVDADIVVVTPHWGPNMVPAPFDYVTAAAAAFRRAGATVVAGHSAHVVHGVADRVLYDLGGFIDDYAVDQQLRNDLGMLFLVTFDGNVPVTVEAVPLALDFCRTRLADPHEAAWIIERFRRACAALGTSVTTTDRRPTIDWQRDRAFHDELDRHEVSDPIRARR